MLRCLVSEKESCSLQQHEGCCRSVISLFVMESGISCLSSDQLMKLAVYSNMRTVQGHTLEAQMLLRGMNAAWTAPLHLDRLEPPAPSAAASSSVSYAPERKAVSEGQTLAARLWARIFHHMQPKAGLSAATVDAPSGSDRPREASTQAMQRFIRCVQCACERAQLHMLPCFCSVFPPFLLLRRSHDRVCVLATLPNSCCAQSCAHSVQVVVVLQVIPCPRRPICSSIGVPCSSKFGGYHNKQFDSGGRGGM